MACFSDLFKFFIVCFIQKVGLSIVLFVCLNLGVSFFFFFWSDLDNPKNSSIIFSSKPSCWYARFNITRAVECISSFKFRPVHFFVPVFFVATRGRSLGETPEPVQLAFCVGSSNQLFPAFRMNGCERGCMVDAIKRWRNGVVRETHFG